MSTRITGDNVVMFRIDEELATLAVHDADNARLMQQQVTTSHADGACNRL